MRSIMEQWRRNVVSEGITDVVFHKTRLDQAAQIMQSNKFMTSVAFGTPADQDQNKGKLYYLSTMRSPTGEYGPGLPAVTFKLDGRKLGQRSKAAAVNYWGPNWESAPDEMEDRVFTDEPFLEPASDYISEVHIGMNIDSSGRKMRPARMKEAEAIAAAAESQGIPAYFYTNEKTYGILNKTKRLTLDQWKKAFKDAGSELDEPWEFGSRSGLLSYVADTLKGTIEIVQALETGNTEGIEKGYRSTWYKIKYDSGGEWARRIQNAVHNSKSEPKARKYIASIGKQIKKYGGLDAFVEWLQGEIKKSEGEQELKQVAERYGFVNEAGAMRQGYKIVAHEDGKLYSLQNPDLQYNVKMGTVESPTNGMFLGTTKNFVIDYYSEMTDKEDALLVYEYDPEDVISGQPDEEGEVKVTKAKLVSMEVI